MIEILGPILAALLGSTMLRKKPYWLFQRVKGTAGWLCLNYPNGNSKRRCKKALEALVLAGYNRDEFLILPKGTTPPKEG